MADATDDLSGKKLTGKKIVVTGVTGQVAKPLAKTLAGDNDVIGVARFSDEAAKAELESAGVQCIPVNLFSPDLSELPTDVDHVVNMAVTKSGRWDIDLTVNATSVGHLMAHFRNVESFLHCSTTAVYAPNGGLPLTEGDPLGNHHADLLPTYSITKISSESVAVFSAEQFEIPTTIARLNVPYGDGWGWPAFHAMMIQHDIPIEVHPDGSIYTPIHDDDIAATLPSLLAHATPEAPIVNWAGNDSVSVAEWATFLGEKLGKPPVIEESDTAIPSANTDTTLQQTITGACSVSWRDGFERLLAGLPDS